MVERFILPKGSLRTQSLVDTTSGNALDTFQNAMQGDGPAANVGDWSEEQMDVLGHDHCAVQQNGLQVRVDTVFENNRACLGTQRILSEFSEGHEERATGFLEVWQAAAVRLAVWVDGDHGEKRGGRTIWPSQGSVWGLLFNHQ